MLELNILSIKYSIHDVVPDVSYCATENTAFHVARLLTFWST